MHILSHLIASAHSIGRTYRCIDEEIAFSFDVSAVLLMLYILLRECYIIYSLNAIFLVATTVASKQNR